MKFVAWVETCKIGSRCEYEFEVADEDLEETAEEAREDFISDAAREALPNVYEWGWREVTE